MNIFYSSYISRCIWSSERQKWTPCCIHFHFFKVAWKVNEIYLLFLFAVPRSGEMHHERSEHRDEGKDPGWMGPDPSFQGQDGERKSSEGGCLVEKLVYTLSEWNPNQITVFNVNIGLLFRMANSTRWWWWCLLEMNSSGNTIWALKMSIQVFVWR